MTIKTLLVPISGATSTSPLETAILAARKFGAHLELLHVKPDPRNMIPYVGEGMSGPLIEEVMSLAERDAADRAVSARAIVEQFISRREIRFADEPSGNDVTASWHEDSGREDEGISAFGRLADMIVVSRPLQEGDVHTSTLFEAALFESGQPLLVAPPAPVGDLGRRVMIAWNGSPEAARAVSAGLPFLAAAESVSIVAVTTWGEGARSAEGVARRLSWHGIKADVTVVKEVPGTVGEQVLLEADRRRADLIVMGAYTQSRLRQMILGGVTRHVISTATIPLVMAH